MNVSTIKTVCWLTSALATAGLGAYVYSFIENVDEKQNPVDRDYMRGVLEQRVDVVLDVKAGLDYDKQVKPSFIHMNWTGKEAPKPVEPGEGPTTPKGPTYKPINELLSILLLQVDLTDPGGSVAHVTFIGNGDEAELMVGDTLPRPNDFAVVHLIDTHGVEFAFKEEGRPNERVSPGALDDESLIVTVDPDGVIRPKRRAIPTAIVRRTENPKETQLLANNNYRLGTEDVDYFNENYADILTNDIRTSTYYDENGKRAGIELTQVKNGSIASRHGAQDGDVIVSINGHSVHSEQEAIKFVKNNSGNFSTWEVVVLRFGKKETIIYNNPD